jgi:MFS family permease
MTTNPVAHPAPSPRTAPLSGGLDSLSGPGRFRRRLVVVGMIAAAVTVLVGHALNVPATLPTGSFLDRIQESPSAFLAGGLLQATSAFLLIPSAIGILALAPSRGSVWATVGAALTGLGAAATGAGLVMITTMMGMLARTDRELAGRVYELAGSSSLGGLPFLLAPAMLVGLLLLGIALLRAGTVHPAIPVVLMVGAVLAGLAPGGGPVGALGHVPLAVALVALAVRLWGRTTSEEPVTA